MRNETSNSLPKVIFIDDDVMTLAWVKNNLNQICNIIGTYKSYDQAEEDISNKNVDIVVLDLHLGSNSPDGVTLARKVKNRFPHLGVILLSGSKDRIYLAKAALSQISGLAYVWKDSVMDAPTILSRFIAAVLRGEVSMDNIIRDEIERRRDSDTDSKLTAEEKEIVGLVCEGYTNKAIGKRLGLAERTIETYLTKIYRVTGVAEEIKDYHSNEVDRRILLIRKWLSSCL